MTVADVPERPGGLAPHIVIVTYNWPPRNASGTHRPYSWARYWSKKGARVTVLTAAKYDFDWPLDLDLPRLEGVTVVEIPYLDRAQRKFAKFMKFAGRKWIDRGRSLLVRLRGRSIDMRERWWVAARSRAAELAGKADVVVSTFGPAASHLIAADMKRANPGLRWIADYRDPWSDNIHAPTSHAQRLKTRRRERETIAAADALTSVSEEMAVRLRQSSGKPVRVVENGFDLPPATVRSNLKAAAARPARPVRIVHTGVIYPGLRDPEPLLRAVAGLLDCGAIVEGDITCDFYGNRIGPVASLAADKAYARFVRTLGHVPREQSIAAQREAHLLLLLESPEPAARGVLPAKIYEYMTSGTPILSLGSAPDSAVAKLLAHTGTGRSLGMDDDSVTDLIRQILAGPVPAWYQPNVDHILGFSRESRADVMYGIVTGGQSSGGPA